LLSYKRIKYYGAAGDDTSWSLRGEKKFPGIFAGADTLILLELSKYIYPFYFFSLSNYFMNQNRIVVNNTTLKNGGK